MSTIKRKREQIEDGLKKIQGENKCLPNLQNSFLKPAAKLVLSTHLTRLCKVSTKFVNLKYFNFYV